MFFDKFLWSKAEEVYDKNNLTSRLIMEQKFFNQEDARYGFV